MPVILGAMLSLLDTRTCAPGEWICATTLQITGNEQWAEVSDLVLGKSAVIVALILLGFVIRWLLHRLVDRLVRKAETGMLPGRVGDSVGQLITRETGSARRVQRAKTMGSLLKSIITGIVFAVVFTMVLSEVGVNIAPILASAGIVGVALGFGAQSLVKDFLSGIFMIVEDQYGVGDAVDLGEAVGTVEAVSLRVTRVRDVNGTVWYVRNGEIVRVGNQSQNWARSVLDITVDYGEDIAKVTRVLRDVAHDLWEDEDFTGVVIEEPEVWGVQDLTQEGVVVRVTLKTAPLEQWRVARTMRERIKARFDFERIRMAHPQRVIFSDPEPNPRQTNETTDLDPEGE
jgi:small-conductance mechanosensitive channel